MSKGFILIFTSKEILIPIFILSSFTEPIISPVMNLLFHIMTGGLRWQGGRLKDGS